MSLTLSPIEANQIPIELLLEADPSTSMINRYLEHAVCFSAHIGDEIIGCCVCHINDDCSLTIFNLAFYSKFQKLGYGKQLLSYVIKQAKFNGLYRIELMTGTFGHQLSFYQRFGFRVESVDKDFFNRHYPEPIFENGIQHQDSLRLVLLLK